MTLTYLSERLHQRRAFEGGRLPKAEGQRLESRPTKRRRRSAPEGRAREALPERHVDVGVSVDNDASDERQQPQPHLRRRLERCVGLLHRGGLPATRLRPKRLRSSRGLRASLRRSRSGVVVVVADVDRVPEQRDRVADLLHAEAKFPSNYYYGV